MASALERGRPSRRILRRDRRGEEASRIAPLILTYHAVEEGPAPLCVAPGLFREHLDALSGLQTVTVSQLADSLQSGSLPRQAVAITFDDGCASAARFAAPLLAERGMTATFFCVAGHLGGRNDWRSQAAGVPTLELATAAELVDVAGLGFEIGAHGMEHAPLGDAGPERSRRELYDAKVVLEDAAGTSVRSVAYPYGVRPSPAAAALTAELYDAGCTTRPARVLAGCDPHELPRVDIHYLRRPALLRRVARGGLDAYVHLRALATSVRRSLP